MTRRSALRRRFSRTERGFVAIEFVVGLGLLLVPVALLMVSVPTWAERQSMARVAARESARTYALTQNTAQAQRVIDDIEANYGVPENTMTVEFSNYPTVPLPTDAAVTATVTVRIPAVNVGLLKVSAAEFDLTEAHSEPLDLYRSRAVAP